MDTPYMPGKASIAGGEARITGSKGFFRGKGGPDFIFRFVMAENSDFGTIYALLLGRSFSRFGKYRVSY
jgi:hypothetical protein